MATSKADLKRAKIAAMEAVFEACGWKKDNWGSFRKVLPRKQQLVRGGPLVPVNVLFRIVIKDIVVRVERQYEVTATTYSKAEKKWMRIGGCNISDARVEENMVVMGSLVVQHGGVK